MVRIQLARVRVQWRGSVCVVINFKVSEKQGICLPDKVLPTFQDPKPQSSVSNPYPELKSYVANKWKKVLQYVTCYWKLSCPSNQRKNVGWGSLRIGWGGSYEGLWGPRKQGSWSSTVRELHVLYFSPYIILEIKSRRMRWGRHVAGTGEKRNAFKALVRKSAGNQRLGDLGIDGCLISK